VQKKYGLPSNTTTGDKLASIHFLQQSHPTYGTLLCFGRELSQWITGAKTRCIRWHGTNNLFGFADSQFYEEGLLQQFEESCEFLRKHLNLGRIIDSQGRAEQWEIPFVVLQEALANALIHREYKNRTDFVQVEIFDDRVDISSPGNLPASLTLDSLKEKHTSHPRNAHIANIFYLFGKVEEAGSGIPRMRHFMKEAGLPEPLFAESKDNRFNVILHRPKQFPNRALQQNEPIWNVPYLPNPHFTGREHILVQLHHTLKGESESRDRAGASTKVQALTGLGGIGKTQIAIEYAYRYRSDYQAILWATANSRETLVSDFVAIATLLDLPERDVQDRNLTIHAVKNWLTTHSSWLLILDNADDLALVAEFLPGGNSGHILITTRTQAIGNIANSFTVGKMETEEAKLFLLRRARVLPRSETIPENLLADAEAIVSTVDGLPLALDQAGAYIEETGSSLQDYIHLYHSRRRTDILKRRGRNAVAHPSSVALTIALSIERVGQVNLGAVDLLRLCAFLAPEAIPIEIFTKGASDLGAILQAVAMDTYELNAAIEELLMYSLISRDPDTHALTIHRLVQTVLIDAMDKQTQKMWAERAVRAVNRAFPDVEVSTWPQWQRLLPHAQVCAVLIREWEMKFVEASRLLSLAGQYLQSRAQLAEAEPFLQQALTITMQVLGPHHRNSADSLNNLARLYDALGKYEQAEPLYQRALGIDEQVLGAEHPDTAISLNNLALLYYNQGKYEQAEPLYQRALAIDEQVLGAEHPEVATDLNNLALLYDTQGKYEQAEPLYQRALKILEHSLGIQHFDTAISLNNLALLYYHQGKYELAEPLLRQALSIGEQLLGAEHPSVAASLENYAALLRETHRETEAQAMEERVNAIRIRDVL
jgi:tetratricopeptide (TPR) repeat protein